MQHEIKTKLKKLEGWVYPDHIGHVLQRPALLFKNATRMEKEIWKDIPGYEGLYQVSSLGRVRSLDRVVPHGRFGEFKLKGRVLKPSPDLNGYLKLNLYKDGMTKTIEVHKLIAIAFLNHEPCGNKIVVDHIDNNKTNNRLDNLQLITHRENLSKDKSGYTSQYVGVSWSKQKNKWMATIQVSGKNKHLGSFDSEYEAHLAYQKALNEISK